ncbi:MAG: 50S ribosomal protein L18 [Simkaniaceae bacterium]|nr:50S ribosomal protein L18 [Simkaniaceae bacterium]
MLNNIADRNRRRDKRKLRIRKRLKKNDKLLRLSIEKSNKHISAQIIDDEKGITVVSCGTKSKDVRDKFSGKSKESARYIGETIGKLAKEKNVTHVMFDRGRFKYHGIIAEIAEGARKAGLQL